MSTSNSNNSGNSINGGTVVITGAGGGGGGGNYITWVPGQTFTFTIPITHQPVAAPVQKKEKRDGCNCKKCKEYFPYAEPNQEDGSLVCYACRHGY